MKCVITALILISLACGREEDYQTEQVQSTEVQESEYTEVCKVIRKGDKYVILKIVSVEVGDAPLYVKLGYMECEGEYDENGYIPAEEN